jgi:hypothetical protein
MCWTLQVFNWSVRLLTWRQDVDRYTTDLVLGVAEPAVVAIHEGFFTFLEMTETVETGI